jgi:hypothetical protein
MMINHMWNQVEVIRLESCESRSIPIVMISHSSRVRCLKSTIAHHPVGVAGTVKVRDNNKRPDMGALLGHRKALFNARLCYDQHHLHKCTSNHICVTRFLNSNDGTGGFKLLWSVYPYPGSGSGANVLVLVRYHEPKKS